MGCFLPYAYGVSANRNTELQLSKNRRDGATVSTRVLALVDKMGQELYANVAATSGRAEEASSSKKRRRKEISTKARL